MWQDSMAAARAMDGELARALASVPGGSQRAEEVADVLRGQPVAWEEAVVVFAAACDARPPGVDDDLALAAVGAAIDRPGSRAERSAWAAESVAP